MQPALSLSPLPSRPAIGPAVPWADEPLHSTLCRSGSFTVYQARIPPGASTLLHSHVGVTAYVVVDAPPSPVCTETVEWGDDDEVGGSPVPVRLVPGEMALSAGAAFSFVVPDPRRPLVHRISAPPGEVMARIVGVEVRGGGVEGDASPPPPRPPFTVAVSGPGFRVLRVVLAEGDTACHVSLRPPAVAITVRGGKGLRDEGGGPPSLLVRAARTDQGVAWTEDAEGDAAVVNGGPGEWECCVVELWPG